MIEQRERAAARRSEQMENYPPVERAPATNFFCGDRPTDRPERQGRGSGRAAPARQNNIWGGEGDAVARPTSGKRRPPSPSQPRGAPFADHRPADVAPRDRPATARRPTGARRFLTNLALFGHILGLFNLGSILALVGPIWSLFGAYWALLALCGAHLSLCGAYLALCGTCGPKSQILPSPNWARATFGDQFGPLRK